MDLFSGHLLLRRDGSEVPVQEALRDKRVLALYFSAHWCPPCRQFTPVLRQSFAQANPARTGVVFVSSDRSHREQMEYMREAHGDWPAVRAGSPLAQQLGSALGIRGIPALVVVNASDGSVITKDGRSDVMRHGAAAFELWESQASPDSSSSSSSGVSSLVDLLRDNPEEVRRDAAEILVKLFGNVRRDPGNIKFRTIKLSNPKIEAKLLAANGAFEILFSAGFEENGDSVILPLSASLITLYAFLDALPPLTTTASAASRPAAATAPSASTTRGAGSSSSNNSRSPRAGAAAASTSSATESSPKPTTLFDKMKNEHEFFRKLEGEVSHVQRYEDPAAQAEARSVVPLERLEAQVKAKFELIRAEDATVKESMLRDLLLLELLGWFKSEFFTWVDEPLCEDGVTKAVAKGSLVPTEQELADGAGTVEGYTSPITNATIRFPRYHALPAKLLQTRRGRCGEFANCFALLCRALRFDTRHVVDWTDHVWVEVWSDCQGRWLHADPCENACDKPLVYERGWGKRLSYVMAASKDEVQDVSWRYSADHDGMKRRRELVRGEWLAKTVLKLTEKCQKEYAPEEKKRLAMRRLVELVELMQPKDPKSAASDDEEAQGRQSGSAAWRIARGEMGPPKAVGKTVWTLKESEKEALAFHLEFDVVKDEYVRASNSGETIRGWENGVSECQDVARKVEEDWGQVYLARTAGSAKSTLKWEFDLTDTGYSARSIELDVSSKTFNTGRVIWQLCGGSICLMPVSGITLKSDELAGSKKISLTAMMSGGQGENAWQHSQLFRTNKDDESVGARPPQLRIVIKLMRD